MTFWILAAVMTAAVAIVLILPLTRRTETGASQQDFDVEVYRDQLQEIDRDVENELISADEAEFARAEIGRRLIKLSKQEQKRSKQGGAMATMGRLAVLVLVPVFSIAGYLALGSPDLPSQPLATRQIDPPRVAQSNGTAAQPDIQNLLQQVESHLAKEPEDGRGWDLLGPIYMRLGRIPEAELAFRNAIRLLGSSPARQAGLGQTLFAQAGGIVTPEAQTAFKAVLVAEPDNPFAAYFMALALAQEGRSDDALEAFSELAERSPADAPWMSLVRQQMQALSGPSQEDMEAAASLSAEDRAEMIEGMVAGLDARLQDEPDNIEGWLRLIRSYMVLGRAEDAGRALGKALAHFQSGSPQQASLEALAAEFGLNSQE